MAPTIEILQVKRIADKSPEALAAHPADHPDKYPTLGLDIVDVRGRSVDPPQATRVSCGWIDARVKDGSVELEGERHIARPGGEPGNEWRRDKIHNFRHADVVVLKTHDGRPDVRYRVTHQPDKYVDTTDYTVPGAYGVGEERVGTRKEADDVAMTPEYYNAGHTRVDHFYDLELES